ncbi:MAG: HdeA/HdeB family chaperone [Candidatus Entotheonellia bacterium]
MKRRILCLVTVIGIIASIHTTPTFSQDPPKEWAVVDLNTLDCRTLLKMTGDERDATVSFYHGIITGVNKEMSVNVPALAETTDKVIDHCIDNPKDILLKVFQDERK